MSELLIIVASVTKYRITLWRWVFPQRQHIYNFHWLFVQPYCGSCYVCVLGAVWRNPFWIVKFCISIPRINHKVENGIKIIGGELWHPLKFIQTPSLAVINERMWCARNMTQYRPISNSIIHLFSFDLLRHCKRPTVKKADLVHLLKVARICGTL